MDKTLYHQLFKQHLVGAIKEQSNGNYNNAVTLYYKAITMFLKYYLFDSGNPEDFKGHLAIMAKLSCENKQMYNIADPMYKSYQQGYEELKDENDCEALKNAIKELIRISGLEKEFKESLEKI